MSNANHMDTFRSMGPDTAKARVFHVCGVHRRIEVKATLLLDHTVFIHAASAAPWDH
jgi:hypothetical protein